MPDESALFPYQNVDMGKASILFDQFQDTEILPWGQHVSLPFAPRESRKVVLAIDGLGSSSAGSSLESVCGWLEEDGFNVCVFSYRGIATRFYQPCDTVVQNFDTL